MRDTLKFLIDRIPTPIGEMVVATDEAGKLRAIDWSDYDPRMARLLDRYYGKNRFRFEPAQNEHMRDAVNRYFAGDVSAIDNLPGETTGTEFQRDVWRELRRIPAGKTISYGTLAERIGRPKAVRAVGLANGANPIGVVVPCHRVIGANGTLTGYGGGMERKQWLLDHERKHASKSDAA